MRRAVGTADGGIFGFLSKRKYDLLLIGLVQHLFVGILVADLNFYVRILWPVNMVILAVLASGLFLETRHWLNRLKFFLFIAVILFPIGLAVQEDVSGYRLALYLTYVAFFCVLFVEVFRYMVRPSYINLDLIVAAICGFLLLIEMFVFTAHVLVHLDPHSFGGVDLSSPPAKFMGLVYYGSITLTTIGYGDLTPLTHQARLTASLFGIAGQFYQVVLVGILISKFVGRRGDEGVA